MAFCAYLGKEFRSLQIYYRKYTGKIHQYWCSLNLDGNRQEIANIHLFLEMHNKYMPLNL
jgi:hypothetical protein